MRVMRPRQARSTNDPRFGLMPTYEYVCDKCGRSFDYFQSMKDPRLEECIFDGCHGKVRRKIGTGAGIIFKGSGFYETDYRSDSYKAAAKKDEGGGSGSEGSGSSGKTEAGGGAKSPDGSGGTKASPGKDSGGAKTSAASGPKQSD